MKTLRSILLLYWQHYPLWFVWGIAISLISALASIALLATAGWYLGSTALSAATGAGAALAFNTIYPGFLIRTAALTRTAGRYGERILTHDTTFRFIARMRLYVFDGISQLSFRRLRDYRSGELLARLTADIDALDGVYLRVLLPLITAILATLVLLVTLHMVDALLAGVIGVILLLTLIVLPMQAAKIGIKLGRRIAFSSEALRLRYIDLLRGQVELIMAGRLDDQVTSIRRACDRIRVLQDTLSVQDLWGRALISLASGLALVAALMLGGLAYERGDMGEPLVLLAILAVLALTELFAPIRRGLLEIGRTLYAGQRILPLMAEPAKEDITEHEDHGVIRLELDRIDFAYSPESRPVLEDFSLHIRSGEAIGIVGESGAGKSTLLGLVAGLLEPLRGRIRLDYEDGRMAHLSPRIGLLTQRTELFRESLAFNLKIADPTADEHALHAVMGEAQLSSLLDRLPAGLEQKLGDEGQGLSGGETRRLALARLLLFKPDLWLLDEATEGLDHDTANQVLATLRRETQSKALVFVTHKRAEAELADRLLILKEGEAPFIVTRTDHQGWSEVMASLR